jgi:hypothetical protein
MSLKQRHIQRVGTPARMAPEFHGLTFHMDQTDPEIFRMAGKTPFKKEHLLVPLFGRRCGFRSRFLLIKGQPVTHATIGAHHTNNFRWCNQF